MQELFFNDKQLSAKLRNSLTEPRLTRYIKACGDDSLAVLPMYYWNCQLSQSLYILTHTWEVGVRNRLNSFLCWKYGKQWPFDEARAVRQLSNTDKHRLREAIDRQRQRRKTSVVSTDAVVADLSAGFWVSLLGKSYDVPFSWRYNLARVLPHDATIDRAEASKICDDLLDLRNRIAHHEPIFHLPLENVKADADRLLAAMCPAIHRFASSTCTFQLIMTQKPHISLASPVNSPTSKI